MKRQDVYKLIDGERDYQNQKWNAATTISENIHSVEAWYTYIEDYIREAQHILSREPQQIADIKQWR